MQVTVDGATTEQFVKRAMYLAWQACGGPLGMGFLQDQPRATEEDVWKNITNAGDYGGGADISGFRRPGEAYADYVFGRMMKLCIEYTAESIEMPRSAWRHDYQAFVGKYPDPKALFDATAESLACTWTATEAQPASKG